MRRLDLIQGDKILGVPLRKFQLPLQIASSFGKRLVTARNIAWVGLSGTALRFGLLLGFAKQLLLPLGGKHLLLNQSRLLPLVVCLLSLTQVIDAQETGEEMTLSKAIAIGLENNFQIKISEKNILIAENNNTWGRAGRAPTVDITGAWTNNLINDSNEASFLRGTFFTSSLGPSLQANYLIYGGGRVGIVKEQLELSVEQSKLLQSVEVANLIRDITAQYYTVLLQEENQTVLQRLLGLSQQRFEFENTRKAFGASNSYNLIQFSNAAVRDSTNLVAQENTLAVAKQNLYTTLNLLGNPNYRYPEKLASVVEEIDGAKLRELLEEENFTIRSLLIANELNALNVKLSKAARKPSLNVNGNYGFNGNYFKFYEDNPNTGEPFEGLFSERLGAGLNLNGIWNIYDGGQRRADVENAALEAEIGEMNLMEAKAQLINQLNILIRNYDNQKGLLTLTEEQLELAEQNLEISEERFRGGQISSLDYNNAQNQLLQAAFSRTAAIYNLILSKNEIDWLVGVYSRPAN